MLRVEYVEQNLKATFTVIWGQCSESMRAKVKSLPEYTEKENESDCVWLLKSIRGIMLRFEGQRYVFLSHSDALQNLCHFRQGIEMSLSTYLEEFQNLVDVYEHYGGSIGASPGLINAIKEGTDKEKTKAARNKTLALSFLKGADRRRFGSLWTDLENQFSRNNDQYPSDLTEAYSMLVSYKATRNQEHTRQLPSSVTTPVSDITGITFTQNGATVAGSDNVTHAQITCFNCNNKGHYASACPTADGIQLLQARDTEQVNGEITDNKQQEIFEFTFAHVNSHNRLIPNTWVLLDSQSTVSVFNNKSFLSSIRRSPKHLKVYTNGGTQTSTLIGDVRNFGPVWYNPNSLANILSLAEVRKRCRVTMDTAIEPAICVHRPNGSIMKFVEFTTGLYYYDTTKVQDNSSNTMLSDYSFVLTVEGNKSRFHRREIEGADRARDLYRKIGRPSHKQFEQILRGNGIRNCPVTVDDARRALLIYGPDIAVLKGKSIKGHAQHVPTFSSIDIPSPILDDHHRVTLCMDFFYVQGIPFLHTISRKLKFRTVSQVPDRSKETMLR